MGLTVSEDKTHVAEFTGTVEFLGCELSDRYPPVDAPGEAETPRRRVLYVTEPGAATRLRQGQVQVFVRDEEVLSVPVRAVGRIVLMGPVGLSAGLRTHALIRDVPVVFLSRHGQWLGRLDGAEGDVRLRRRQYRFTEDPQAGPPVAAAMVQGKLANQRALLLRYARREAAEQVVDVAEHLDDLRERAGAADRVPSLMGLEGTGTKRYFEALARLLPDGFAFDGRNRRPPRDPVNSALSLGYSLLLDEAVAALATVGLDPHAGILHADVTRRPSLALDLMEEFRPLIVDTVVLNLLRRHRLTPEHFRQSPDSDAVLLTKEGRRQYLDGYEERMLQRFTHTPSGRRVSYRRALHLQADQLAAVIQGLLPTYEPVGWR